MVFVAAINSILYPESSYRHCINQWVWLFLIKLYLSNQATIQFWPMGWAVVCPPPALDEGLFQSSRSKICSSSLYCLQKLFFVFFFFFLRYWLVVFTFFHLPSLISLSSKFLTWKIYLPGPYFGWSEVICAKAFSIVLGTQ